ncbi:hypothetical protein HDU89_005757 [Geranomyces variabilis]|nr:hypothetical protein HDU89_005757 [Geranomyces variabilis]
MHATPIIPPSPEPNAVPPPSSCRSSTRSRARSLSQLAAAVYVSLFGSGEVTRLAPFIAAVLTRCNTPTSTMFLALKYLAACAHAASPELAKYTTCSAKTISLDPLLLLTAAIALADEFVNSDTHGHAVNAYAAAAGFTRKALSNAKRAICTVLAGELTVPPEIFTAFVAWLRDFALTAAGGHSGSGRRIARAAVLERKKSAADTGRLELTIRRALVARMMTTASDFGTAFSHRSAAVAVA